MDKSIHSPEYAEFLGLLRAARLAAGVTHVELAARLGRSQSFVSKVEVGETRLDVIQLRSICRALGVSLPVFVGRLEARLAKAGRGTGHR